MQAGARLHLPDYFRSRPLHHITSPQIILAAGPQKEEVCGFIRIWIRIWPVLKSISLLAMTAGSDACIRDLMVVVVLAHSHYENPLTESYLSSLASLPLLHKSLA